MTLETMRLRVAEELTILSDDETTIKEGVVTSNGIDNRLNDIYREELFPLFSDKYPEDFTQNTFPANTYTVSAVVDAATSGTTLVITTDVMDNSMVGFKLQNGSTLDTVEVTGFTNDSTVTVDAEVDDWIGDTIYVLGNEYSFGGSTVDLKEVIQFNVKYKSSDANYLVAQPRNYRDVVSHGGERFSTMSPMWYRTTIKVEGIPVPGFGILPYPTDYTGTYQFSYTQRPEPLEEDQEPLINTAGISECMIYGCLVWGHRLMGRTQESAICKGLYEEAKRNIVAHYKPRNRAGAPKVRQSEIMTGMGRRYF